MKKLLLIVILSCSVVLTFGQTPNKYALLIGVSEYKRGVNPDSDWWNLNAKPDILALKQVLTRKFGFKPADISTLTTRPETTRQSMLNAFRDLVEKVQPGDIVYLHYSGHGSQVADDNGDEIDGLDESLVPSDYKSRKDGSNNLRDDEIGKFLNALKAKNPASVIFTFDSCFSGTITRGGRQLVRGESYQGKTPKTNPQAVADDSSGILPGKSLSNNFVVISATRSDQTAKETDDDTGGKMGTLTYALVKALGEANPKTSYRDVFDRVQTIVTQRAQAQNPQIEGDSDTVLLKGTASPAETYILVMPDQNYKPILQAGSLQGMTKGSKFAIFPPGTKSVAEGKKLTDAEIVQLDATTATLKLATPIKPEIFQGSRAFEIEHSYSDTLLRVAFSGKSPEPAIVSELKKFSLVEVTTRDDWDVRIDQSKVASTRGEIGKITLERADGTKLSEIENNQDLAKNIRLMLEREARFRTIRSLENSSPSLKIEMRVVPVEVETNARGNITKVIKDKVLSPNSGGKIELSENDYVAIEVRNTGDQSAWVTILDLTADGKIGPMFPHPRVAMPDNKIIADGKWKRLPLPFVFRITPPFGQEIYKVIATPELTDFSPILDPTTLRGGDERVEKATQSPLGKILRSATLTQRSEIGGGAPPNWATAEVSFEVIKK